MIDPSDPNSLTIVIPCYNEEFRLDLNEYQNSMSKNENINVLFVNDGSSDNTITVLESLKEQFPKKVEILDLKKNQGKAEAVRQGFDHCLKKVTSSKIAYIDADLATSIEECIQLGEMIEGDIKFVFGSRIVRVGANVERRFFRFFIGRFIATFISNILHLGVYDTQCGAKVFERELANYAFEKKFISKWLFDVELFARVLTEENKFSEKNMLEIPLKQWIDKDGSKVKASYMFKLFIDLFRIRKAYPALRKRKN